MKAILRTKIKVGTKVIEKGSQGIIMGVSNSQAMKKEFPNFTEGDGFYYIVNFPQAPDCLIDKNKIDII
jgi:hypothetical protein